MALCLLLYWRMPRVDSLPNDVESLKKLLSAAHDQVQRLSAQLHSRDVLIEKMKLQLAQLKRMKFGRSSEQLDAQIAQLELSLEELEANAAEAPIATASTTPANSAIKPARQALPADLPCESHRYEPHTGSCNCPQCGGSLRAFGEDVSEVLEYVPEHWKVHRHVRPKYSCTSCEHLVHANAPVPPYRARLRWPPDCSLTSLSPSTAIINRCIDRARSMLVRVWSWIAPHWPSGSAR